NADICLIRLGEKRFSNRKDDMADLNALRGELNRMANAQFDTPEFQRLLSVRFTLPRALLHYSQCIFITRTAGIVGVLFLAPPPWM
ncbi:MAG TPA: hypothetical protein VGA01_03185, partial [Candidatus Binatia bacterium]